MSGRRFLGPVCAFVIIAAAIGLRSPNVASSAGRVLVSLPDHRTSEFTASENPSDPDHLAVAAIDWDTARGTWSCVVSISRDGGETWSGHIVAPSMDYDAQGDPWVAIGPDGTVHAVCLELEIRDQGGANLIYTRSADGGTTWSDPTVLAPRAPQHSVDRTGVAALPSGVIVACVNEYDFPNAVEPAIFDGLAVAISADGGQSWEPTRQLTETYSACRGSAVGPNGELYLSFVGLDGGGSGTATIRSDDDGQTWTAPSWIQNLGGDSAGDVYYGGSIAVSHDTGHVFVARPGSEPRVFASTDQGTTYEPLTLPAIPTQCTRCTNVVRTIASVNARGDLGVQVEIGDLDLSAQGEAYVPYPAPVTKEVWLLVSSDEGASWFDPILVDAADVSSSYLHPLVFAPAPTTATGLAGGATGNPNDAQGNFWATAGPLQRTDHLINGGDYTGMTTSGDAFVPMWIAHYNGIPQVWAVRVSVDAAN